MTKSQQDKTVSRRRFLKGSAVAAGTAATATVAMPNISRAETTVLKMQSSWGSNSVFQDMARQYTERCEKMSGGRLKFDLLPAGAVVKAFEVQNACDSGVIDCAHTVTAYWYGKNKAASLFGTCPVFGVDSTQTLAWIQSPEGSELYRELVQDILKLDVIGFFTLPMPTQPLGWFKKDINSIKDLRRLKYRTVGLATDIMQRLGMRVTQLPGGEIIPAYERGVIDAFEFNNPTADRQLGAQNVSKNFVLASYHQPAEFFEIIFSKKKFESLAPDLQAICQYAAEATSSANLALAYDRYSKDLLGLINEDGVKVTRTPDSVLEAQLESWDKVLKKLERDPFFKKVLDSQRAWAERVGFFSHSNTADFKKAYKHYFPGKLND
ncbi:MAG: TRAP transporter substrate-binding protein [Hyphomicrobiaceae bacterium]